MERNFCCQNWVSSGFNPDWRLFEIETRTYATWWLRFTDSKLESNLLSVGKTHSWKYFFLSHNLFSYIATMYEPSDWTMALSRFRDTTAQNLSCSFYNSMCNVPMSPLEDAGLFHCTNAFGPPHIKKFFQNVLVFTYW